MLSNFKTATNITGWIDWWCFYATFRLIRGRQFGGGCGSTQRKSLTIYRKIDNPNPLSRLESSVLTLAGFELETSVMTG